MLLVFLGQTGPHTPQRSLPSCGCLPLELVAKIGHEDQDDISVPGSDTQNGWRRRSLLKQRQVAHRSSFDLTRIPIALLAPTCMCNLPRGRRNNTPHELTIPSNTSPISSSLHHLASLASIAVEGDLMSKIRNASLTLATVGLFASMMLTVAAPRHAGAAVRCTPAPRAYLVGCNFAGKNLRWKNFTGANLTGANLSRADIRFANFTGARLVSASLAHANMASAIARNADFTYADFTGTAASSLILTGSNVTKTNFSGLMGNGLRTGSLRGTPAKFPSTNWGLFRGYLVGPRVDLSGANLSMLSFHRNCGTYWCRINFSGANLTNANLQGSTLIIDATGANFTGANLHATNIFGTIFDGANFTGANFSGASLGWGRSSCNSGCGVWVSGTDFSDANFNNVNASYLNGDPDYMPGDWVLTDGVLVGPNVNLDYINLSNCDLSQITTGGITGHGYTLPSDWSLLNGFLVGPGAYLRGADLSYEDLSYLDLSNADFSDANLSNADLDNSTLTGANFAQAQIGGASFYNTDLGSVNAYGLIGDPSGLPYGWTVSDGNFVQTY